MNCQNDGNSALSPFFPMTEFGWLGLGGGWWCGEMKAKRQADPTTSSSPNSVYSRTKTQIQI